MPQAINYQNKRHPLIREFIAKTILFLADISIIFAVLFVTFILNDFIKGEPIELQEVLNSCIYIYPAYIIISCIFFYEGIYSHRFDFWHESRKILKVYFYHFLLLLHLEL